MPRFILQEELRTGVDVATCPSCSLVIKVIYDQVTCGYYFVYSLLLLLYIFMIFLIT